jgi:hypothetical protein
MKRAAELFTIEVRPSRSAFVEQVWRARSEPEESFISVAASHWEMVVTRQGAEARLTVRGPETKATIVSIPQDAEFFGIRFSLGTFMPGLGPAQLVDRTVTLPPAAASSFWLHGSAWGLPGPADAEAFVDRLAGAGLLVHDAVASAAAEAHVPDLSPRSQERRVARATGLTRGAIRQIRRAEAAVDLLARGVPAVDVVGRAGYADQSHLTRSLRRFVGQTPARIAVSAASG